MAATSLAEQLTRLSAPHASTLKDDTKVVSLLFDPKEAANKDRDTFYEIGLSGLRELIAVYEGFRVFEDNLFSLSSKDFERALQSKEVNNNLDQTIEKFLLNLSPYLLLQSSHKALEWLINRYHIHQYNQNAIMGLILPYHNTKIFVRIVQLMDISSNTNKWKWLQPIQKKGIVLSKQVLFNQCVSNTHTLQFIAKSTMKYVEEFSEKATQLNIIFSFFSQTCIGAISSSKNVNEATVTVLLPTLIKGLESNVADFKASVYVVLGYLFTKTTLKGETINYIAHLLLSNEIELSYEAVLLITLLYESQRHLTKMSLNVLADISVDVMNILCRHMKELVKQGGSVHAFVVVLLSSLLPQIQSEEYWRYWELPEILIANVDLTNQKPDVIIKCILDQFWASYFNTGDDDSSDLETIEEEEFHGKSLNWYAQLLKTVEQQYPGPFDSVVKEQMNVTSKKSTKQKKQLATLLGVKPALAIKAGNTNLFENLNHVHATLRVDAINFIAKEFDSIKTESAEFIKGSIINRFLDDVPEVVNAALNIPDVHLKQIFDEADTAYVFVGIISKSSKKWRPVCLKALLKFCSFDLLPVKQATVLAVFPYLFPEDQESAKVTCQILQSTWGKKLGLVSKTQKLPSSLVEDPDKLCKLIFKNIFTDRKIDLKGMLDDTQLNRQNTLEVYLYMLLKITYFENPTVDETSAILNLLLDSVETRSIVSCSEEVSFSSLIMHEFFKESSRDNILFEIIEYILTQVIIRLPVKEVTLPWCDVCKSSELVLVRRLYEICIIGCAIPSYGQYYITLLKKLLEKFCKGPQEKFEFVANFASGHILYAANPKDVVGPELQLRSLKLMTNFIAAQDDSEWLYDSPVVIVTILLCLNNPLKLIREAAFDIMNKLTQQAPNKSFTNIQLFEQLRAHKEEMMHDHDQVKQVLKTILSQKNHKGLNFLVKLMGILKSDAPSHIKSSLITILGEISNATTFPYIMEALKPLQMMLDENSGNPNLALNIYESSMFKNIYSFINENTVSTFAKDSVWDTIEAGLKEYRECIIEEDQTFVSPAVLIMKQIDEAVFNRIPAERANSLVYLIASAGFLSNNPKISSVASKAIRKIHIEFSHFKPIIEGMLNVDDPGANVSTKKKREVSVYSYQITMTPEWKLGVAFLENIQDKKKMKLDNSFVSTLFQLLTKCLKFEEQSYVEYAKQLILSLLWYFCKKFVDEKDPEQMAFLKSVFDVELVVQCIRGTTNSQTHHHALILLTHAACVFPEQVLHHTMEIFTFMGSSVLRHDDTYSFQIITKIIETLIPILVKLDRNVDEYSEKELQQLQRRVVPVLRIFADIVLHVPEHRRTALFKKLVETLGPKEFLWVFIALLLEAHVSHFSDDKKEGESPQTSKATYQESPINRLDFGQIILLEFSPEMVLETFVKLITYIKSLPLQKPEKSMDTDIDVGDIFSVNGHSSVQLRHYKYVVITFMNTCLASSQFIHHTSQATDVKHMEANYKTFIVNLLSFIQMISQVVTDEKTVKYWRVMLHHSYDLLDHTNNLLSTTMFLNVVKGLMKHGLQTVRRKAMELLNSKLQFSPEIFEGVNNNLIFSLLPPLLDIIKTLEGNAEVTGESMVQELELNQQTALLTLKLLIKMRASANPEVFKPVLEIVTDYVCTPSIQGNVMASVVLCLSELCYNMKAHALGSLWKFVPALIKVLKRQRSSETPELVLLSTLTAIARVIESLPLFLSPYMQKILYEYSMLLIKWENQDQECNRVSAIMTKLQNIKKKIAKFIPPRVLIPVVGQTHEMLLEKKDYDGVGPIMSVLAYSFEKVTIADLSALQTDLTQFFLSALQLRCEATGMDPQVIDKAEDEVINALVCLVLKLSEASFRPFYFKLHDWAIRTNVEGSKDKTLTFYRTTYAIAEKLKGLFVLFAGHFIKNAADLLDACNNSKNEELYLDSEDKCLMLIEYIVKTLYAVFLYDNNQTFLNKDRFEILMQPVVDQLENTVGGIHSYKARATEYVIPCISQFAVATADDSLWKLLNYQILLKTRQNDIEIRLTALECVVSVAGQLGSSWLPLLAESVPFLAELLEDGDSRIETSTKNAIRKLEQILGEPLEKYFS